MDYLNSSIYSTLRQRKHCPKDALDEKSQGVYEADKDRQGKGLFRRSHGKGKPEPEIIISNRDSMNELSSPSKKHRKSQLLSIQTIFGRIFHMIRPNPEPKKKMIDIDIERGPISPIQSDLRAFSVDVNDGLVRNEDDVNQSLDHTVTNSRQSQAEGAIDDKLLSNSGFINQNHSIGLSHSDPGEAANEKEAVKTNQKVAILRRDDALDLLPLDREYDSDDDVFDDEELEGKLLGIETSSDMVHGHPNHIYGKNSDQVNAIESIGAAHSKDCQLSPRNNADSIKNSSDHQKYRYR